MKTYNRATITNEKFDSRRVIVGYPAAAEHAGISRTALIAAAVAGDIKPVASIQTGKPGRPPLAFKRSDLKSLARSMQSA